MLIDVRYHLGSLVAVFLALGLGILIGAVAFQDRVVGGQERLVSELEARFTELKKDRARLEERVETLTAELTAAEEFISEALPVLIKDRLTGIKVGIIAGSDAALDMARNLQELVAQAGGKVSEVRVLEDTGLPSSAEELTSLLDDPDCVVYLSPNPAADDTQADTLSPAALKELAEGGTSVVIGSVGKLPEADGLQRWRHMAVANLQSPQQKFELIRLLSGESS